MFYGVLPLDEPPINTKVEESNLLSPAPNAITDTHWAHIILISDQSGNSKSGIIAAGLNTTL